MIYWVYWIQKTLKYDQSKTNIPFNLTMRDDAFNVNILLSFKVNKIKYSLI